MSKKFLPLVSALLILVFVISACAPKPAATVAPVEPVVAAVKGKVVIWHSKKVEETNSLNAIIDAFKAKYPDVTVEQLFVPDDDLRNKFETAVGSGSGPTMLIGSADWGPASFDAQLVQDITPMMTEGLLETLNDAAAASVQYKGAVVGLPIKS